MIGGLSGCPRGKRLWLNVLSHPAEQAEQARACFFLATDLVVRLWNCGASGKGAAILAYIKWLCGATFLHLPGQGSRWYIFSFTKNWMTPPGATPVGMMTCTIWNAGGVVAMAQFMDLL
jgi:hypothetical protein